MTHRRRGWLAAGLVAAMTLGCGGAEPREAPEDVARALVEAATARDADRLTGLFPTRNQLGEAMSCRAGEGPSDRLPSEIQGLLRDRDTLAEITSFERFDGLALEPVPIGGEHRGCQAVVPLVMARGTGVFKAKQADGTVEERREDVRLVKLGEAGWFLLSM